MEFEPTDVIAGAFSHARRVQMDRRFVARMEWAFKTRREQRQSASACVSEHHRRISVTALALSDTQLEILRRFAVPVPQQLRALYLASVSRRLAGVELGDGSVQAACIAAQKEVINGACAGAA
jgi:hypothetical protein